MFAFFQLSPPAARYPSPCLPPTTSGTTTDLYYSAGWQVLEEAVSGTTKARYVWSPVYVDALILRVRDADGSSGNGLEERLWVVQDGNFNVTALVNGSGSVIERYAYDPFGQVSHLNADFSVKVEGSGYAWTVLFQGFHQDQVTGNYGADKRWYSPTLGRWITTDPLLCAGNDTNLYRAMANNLVKYVDPTGELFWVPLIIIGGAIFVGTSGYANAPTNKGESTVGPVPPSVVLEGAGVGAAYGTGVVTVAYAPTLVGSVGECGGAGVAGIAVIFGKKVLPKILPKRQPAIPKAPNAPKPG